MTSLGAKMSKILNEVKNCAMCKSVCKKAKNKINANKSLKTNDLFCHYHALELDRIYK